MKRVVLLFGIVCSMLSVYADENILQTIEIEPVKDTYNIVLVSDKAVDVKKTVQADNKINIDLKDIRASKTLNTIYNNVSNVDTVMVEPQGNGISIFFQAENAKSATVSFDSLAPASATPIQNTKTEKQKIKLNNPIESYAPIYNETFEQEKTSNLFKKLKEKSSIGSYTRSIDEDPLEEEGLRNNDTLNKTISFGLVGLLAFAVIRLFKRKEPEMRIGLAQQQFNDREFSLASPLQQSYSASASTKPFTTVNYGLNAYKNENRNPYETAPMQFHNPNLRNMAAQVTKDAMFRQALTPSAATVTQTKAATQQQTKKMTTPVNTAPVNQSNPNVDNLKFLESMTAIYEKSGRYDLARGLKQSLNKNNIQ